MKKVVGLILLVIIISVSISSGASNPRLVTKPVPPPEYYDAIILGVDRRPGEKNGRSDVIMIVHCEPKRITLFSIPRDTVVPIYRTKSDKINAAYSWGNIELAKSTIERFLRLKVDNYIVLDFQTFLTTIDTIKALTDDGRLIGADNFLVSGENLLKWLRWRGMPAGDRRRAQRHQLFIKRIFEYTRKMYINQPAIFSQCMKAGLKIVKTDLTYEHVAELYETYKTIDLDKDIERFVLPGYGKAYYESESATGEATLTGWYYYPKYDWSLMTYLEWWRKNNMQMNYVEEDTLRK